MGLSNDLVSQFVKATKDEKKTKKETTVYGTVVDYNNSTYVKLDGSDILTPVIATVDAKSGERVVVLLKNHTATVTGNLTSPAVRTETVNVINDNITEVKTVVADKVNASELEAVKARVDTLEANNIEVDNLIANYAELKNLTTEHFTTIDADIDNLKTNKLDVSTANATYATISNLNATDAKIGNLQSELGSFKTLTTDNFTAINASIASLQAGKLSAEDIEGKYANIDFSNISKATMGEFYANSGLIQNVVVGESTITGKLVGVTISGDLIEGNTVKAEKLVIKGTDGIYYKLNTDGMKTEAQQTDQNSLDGSVIKAKSITATKISVSDLVAFNATIGGFTIADSALYSGAKTSAANTTRGVYLGKDAQTAIGDGNSYIKYYKDSSNNYKLDILADGIALTSGTNVSDELSSLGTRVTSAESSITIIANSIASNVTETTNLGTRMSTIEQTADGLTTRLDDTDSNIANMEDNIAEVQTAANTAKQTATNFLSFDSTNGVMIGNKTLGVWRGIRAQIKTSEFNILDSSGVVLASYGSTATIGKTSGNNIYVDGNGVNVRKNGKVLATFDQYGLKIANTNDSSGSLGSGTTKPALVIGTETGYHIEMDNNEIMAKSDAATSSHLFLNMEGGNVSINNNASRALMFQNGALYAKNSSFYNGNYLGIIDALNDSGNTVFGYGGYVNKIGGTNIYGNSISLISNGNVDVEASWINCRSITPSAHATYALGTYGEKGWSNIYLGAGDNKTNALHIIVGSSTYGLCGRNSSGQYFIGNNSAIMYYQAKDVNTSITGNAFKITSGNNAASNNSTSVWFFGGADTTSRYIGSYLAYNRTYSAASNMVITESGVFGRSTSSSERYKKDIQLADINELKGLYDLPVKKFKYKDDYIATDDELYGKDLYGFIVEDLDGILPCAVQHIKNEDDETVPEMWNSNIIIPSLLKLIQDLNNRLSNLEKKGV